MPNVIKQGSTVKATYTYLADGTKIKAVNASGAGFDYIGSFKYNRSNSNITLECVATAGGRTYKTSSGYEARYFISDHLGSIRLVASANGTVLEQNDYMPYGERHSNSALAASINPYLYNGKESQKDFGINYIDSEARFQRLDGAFNSIDPLSEENYWISPYTYCNSNPVKFIDNDGKKVYFAPNVSNEFKNRFTSTVKYMNKQGTSHGLALLEASDNVYYITEGDGKFNVSTNTIHWNPMHIIETNNGKYLFPATILGHEIDHAVHKDLDETKFNQDRYSVDANYDNKEERNVITSTEQVVARKHNDIKKDELTRLDHGGQIHVINTQLPPNTILDDYKKSIKKILKDKH